jgi:hypothetical protein
MTKFRVTEQDICSDNAADFYTGGQRLVLARASATSISRLKFLAGLFSPFEKMPGQELKHITPPFPVLAVYRA